MIGPLKHRDGSIRLLGSGLDRTTFVELATIDEDGSIRIRDRIIGKVMNASVVEFYEILARMVSNQREDDWRTILALEKLHMQAVDALRKARNSKVCVPDGIAEIAAERDRYAAALLDVDSSLPLCSMNQAECQCAKHTARRALEREVAGE